MANCNIQRLLQLHAALFKRIREAQELLQIYKNSTNFDLGVFEFLFLVVVVWRTWMFDEQHECQASAGLNVLLCKSARVRVALSATGGILSALAPLLKETVFFLWEYRQASERQELAH